MRLCLAVLSLLVVSVAVAQDQEPRTFTYKHTKEANLALAVHYPPDWKASDKRPAIVFFFGGGWTKGRIEQFEPQATHLARRGMVAVRADYRVKSRHDVTPVECVEDAKSAIRWVRQHAAELGIDTHRIVAAGGSAGGHIAACTALCPGLDRTDEDASISSQPDALLLYNPVLNFNAPSLKSRIGNDDAIAQKISPTVHLKKESPPTLLLYGTDDRLLAQGEEFMAKSKSLATGRNSSSPKESATASSTAHPGSKRPPTAPTPS
jgi:acetyl esterase/lipase